MPSVSTGATALARLHDLGLTLPDPGQDDPRYVSFQRLGPSIYVSGQLPYVDGQLAAQGLVGRDVGVEEARELARLAAHQRPDRR